MRAEEHHIVVSVVENEQPRRAVLSLQPILNQAAFVGLGIVVPWNLAFLRDLQNTLVKSLRITGMHPKDEHLRERFTRPVCVFDGNLGFPASGKQLYIHG